MYQLYLNCSILFGCENNALNIISKDDILFKIQLLDVTWKLNTSSPWWRDAEDSDQCYGCQRTWVFYGSLN